MKSLLLSFTFLIFTSFAWAQENSPSEKLWNEKEPLQVADFKMNTKSPNSFAQFSLSYGVTGLDFMTKNFNKKVKNVMLTEASYINLEDVERTLAYQQILFDIAEVYAREFRKKLLENRKKLASNVAFAEELSNTLTTEMSKEKARFEQESKSGTDAEVMQKWKQKTNQRIADLAVFSYENDEKIKLQK